MRGAMLSEELSILGEKWECETRDLDGVFAGGEHCVRSGIKQEIKTQEEEEEDDEEEPAVTYTGKLENIDRFPS